MIRRWRSAGYGRAAGATNDTEGLQTDVMRFMSILGICLMAVFALVQSIPLHDETAPGEGEHESNEALHQSTKALEQELRVMHTRLEQSKQQLADEAGLLNATRQQFAETVERLDQAQIDQQRLEDKRDRLTRQLEQGRDEIIAVRQLTDAKAQELSKVQAQLRRETDTLNKLRQEKIRLQREGALPATQPVLPEQRYAQTQRPSTPPQDIPERKAQSTGITEPSKEPVSATTVASPVPALSSTGFTLRFASDEALARQLATGDVQLFAMADQKAWRVTIANRRPTLTNASFPGWFHEMSLSTVPPDYVRALKNKLKTRATDTVVWGVQLPPTLKQSIASLTRGRKGGDLVITTDGQVRLAEE